MEELKSLEELKKLKKYPHRSIQGLSQNWRISWRKRCRTGKTGKKRSEIFYLEAEEIAEKVDEVVVEETVVGLFVEAVREAAEEVKRLSLVDRP